MRLDTLELDVADAVAIITLARPERGNALDAQAGRDWRAAALACSTDPAVRAVLIRAQGKAFCVGGDLRDFVTQSSLGPAVKDMTVDFHAAQAMFARMPVPVVAAVQGAAAGAGVSIAAVCDHVVAARSATFTYAYAGVGFTADGGLTWMLPRLMGLRRFQDFVLSGRSLSAAEALDVGIVSEVVDDDACDEIARSMAARLAAGPTLAYAGIKRLALAAFSQGFEQHLEDEAQALLRVAASDDARGAIAAVAARRRPEFAGR